MKKSYKTPAMCVIQFQHQDNLLQASNVSGMFTDNGPDGGWDVGGANAKGYNTIDWDDLN